MIYSGRKWRIGPKKLRFLESPSLITVKYNSLMDEPEIRCGWHSFTEELLDMLAILRKCKKEKREDKI